MDFAALPPEINSTKLYTGPGVTPLLAAATAWEQLAAELSFSAASYRSVIAHLTSTGWQGPASAQMADAGARYVGWLHETAAQAKQTAVQAVSAADAYQMALSAAVPPASIAANRSRLLVLIAGNLLGQNSSAIAATEAEYDEMWALDAAVMHGYAGSAGAAAQLTPFSQPPQSPRPGETAAQIAAVAQAAAAGAGHAKDVTALSGLTGGLQNLASSMPASSAATSVGTVPTIGGEPITAYAFQATSYGGMALSTNDEVWRLIALGTRMSGWYGSALRDFAQGIGPFSPLYGIPLPPSASITSATTPVSAVMDRASVVGGLSIPASWATAREPAVDTAALSMAAADLGPRAAAITSGTTLFGESLMGTLAGRAVSAAAKSRPDKTNESRTPTTDESSSGHSGSAASAHQSAGGRQASDS